MHNHKKPAADPLQALRKLLEADMELYEQSIKDGKPFEAVKKIYMRMKENYSNSSVIVQELLS